MTLFLCDPPDAHVPERFPRDWLAFQQHRSAFGNEKSDVFDVIRNPKGPEYWQAAHQRPIHDAIPEVAARIEFMHWLLERLDTWLFDICDVANFLKSQQADADIDSIAAFEHFLSINRLIQRIASLATSSDIGNAKTIVFEVADLLGTIRRRFNPNKNDVATFKELFDPDIAPKIIVSALLTIPGVGSDLAKIAITVYEKLRETIINSVWIRSKVDPDGILVADKDLKSESKEGFGEFVANVMRALRNGHHGYFTEPKFHNIPSRYLFMVDGNTPNEMIQLPMLWFLAYLADPSILDWKPLPFGHFD